MKKLSFLFAFAILSAFIVSCDKLPTRPGGGTGGGNNGGGDPTDPNDSNTVVCVDRSLMDSTVECPKEIRPVCGCNGVTYKNPCDAKRHGVVRFKEGACRPNNGGNDTTNVRPCIDKRLIDPNAQCPDFLRPVCGCDGKTYKNPCAAKAHGVTRYKEGRCDGSNLPPRDTTNTNLCIDKEKINPDAICPEIHRPVCGCNGKTYVNPCAAEAHGVTKWKEGPCGILPPPPTNDCIDKSLIDPNKECPREADPVCGCNGQTYVNACDARRHGVKNWKPGKCPDRNNLPE